MPHRDPTTPTAAPSRALSFDRAAAQYAAARPGYPPVLFAAVEELTGHPLRGARTLDIGAGTGISTRLLSECGAHVTAVEPGPGMAAELYRTLPHVPIVRGDGNRPPLGRSNSAVAPAASPTAASGAGTTRAARRHRGHSTRTASVPTPTATAAPSPPYP